MDSLSFDAKIVLLLFLLLLILFLILIFLFFVAANEEEFLHVDAKMCMISPSCTTYVLLSSR
jgi:hypothetical protein